MHFFFTFATVFSNLLIIKFRQTECNILTSKGAFIRNVKCHASFGIALIWTLKCYAELSFVFHTSSMEYAKNTSFEIYILNNCFSFMEKPLDITCFKIN